MITRRDVLLGASYAWILVSCLPLIGCTSRSASKSSRSVGDIVADEATRCINVVNFIRSVEPRSPVDLLLPVQRQMEQLRDRALPATWLLQFDALVDGPFVEFLRTNMPSDHEVGFWFEMNQKLCNAADVEWRGRPGLEWDSHPAVAFTIGYTPAERIKLADAAMNGFKAVWGGYPRSIASWNLDSITIAYLSEHYAIDAFAVCRDQIATDGFTIWGAPIAGYFPSKTNCWSPAVHRDQQISTPVFRMLGQDPVYYYDNAFKLPDGRIVREPDTMEPVWTSGRSTTFVDAFLRMIADGPTLRFAYAQLGQENNFGWPEMTQAYPMQMDALARLRDANRVQVETMGTTGRRFKRRFDSTPAQAQVMLDDPFANNDPAQGSIWYQSRFYRANLHLQGETFYFRDLTVYSDRNPQPFLNTATRDHEVHQRMPAVLDGYHWRKDAATPAGGFFVVSGQRLKLSGRPIVRETGDVLIVDLPVDGARTLSIRFDEGAITMRLSNAGDSPLTLSFEWDATKSSLVGVTEREASYRWQAFDYSVGLAVGQSKGSQLGWIATANDQTIVLSMAQSAG